MDVLQQTVLSMTLTRERPLHSDAHNYAGQNENGNILHHSTTDHDISKDITLSKQLASNKRRWITTTHQLVYLNYIRLLQEKHQEIGRAHVRTPVTEKSRMPSSA